MSLDNIMLVDEDFEIFSESSFLSLLSSINDQTDNSSDNKKHKASVSRPGRYKKAPFPMIPTLDLRRTIAQMYANVFNSGDLRLTMQFYEQYFHPDCRLYRKDGDSLQQLTTSRVGAFAMSLCLLSFMPDIVYSLQAVQVRRPNLFSKECHIVIQSTLSGTRVLDPDCKSVSQSLQQHCHNESVDSLLQVIRYSPNIMQSPNMQ